MATSIGGVPIAFGDPRQPKAFPLSHPKTRREGFKTESKVLPKGHVRRKGCLPLPCDVQLDRDQPVKLRDGVTVYVDVYRPVTGPNTAKSPAIIAWSPYGKAGGQGTQLLDDFPFRVGVPLRELSEFQKWEGPDPAYWVQYGYAVVNADSRGVGKSEGDIYCMGSQEGRDGADVVDWAGSQTWCNGKVGLSGNSWLAATQWFIAAEKPKCLAAIAPWEGLSDLYREAALVGGVESKSTLNFILQILHVNAGENSWENACEMALKHKIHGPYHQDKAAVIENIDVPAYVVASWSNVIHVYGTFRAYSRLRSDKWLRVHDTMEWPDYYDPIHRADLHRFFDRYLKGVENGWETTPPLRAKIIDTSNPLPRTGKTISASSFPPENVPLRLFFDGNEGLSPVYPQVTVASYQAKTGQLVFEYTFAEDTTCCGTIEMHLAISLTGAEDSDLFVYFEKLSTTRKVCEQLTVPFATGTQTSLIRTLHWLNLSPLTRVLHYRGPRGQLRLSRREEDKEIEVPGFPISRMDVFNPIEEGEVMIVRPRILPIGMSFRAGETIRIRISGTDESVMPPTQSHSLTVEGLRGVNENGNVTIHCGLDDPAQASFVTLPLLKPHLSCR